MAEQAASIKQVGRNAGAVGVAGAKAPGRGGVAVAPTRTIPPIPWLAWGLGLLFLVTAIAAVSMLVYKHFTHASIPGCHAGSACDALDSHILGRILFPSGVAGALKFSKWPVSFLGLSYYAAIACAWLIAGRRIAPGLRWMIRLGAVISVVYMTVIMITAKFCPYCIASHAANFALLASMEIGVMMAKRSGTGSMSPAAANARSRRSGLLSLAAFALAFAGMTGWLGSKEHGIALAAEAKLAESSRLMLEKAQQDAAKAAAAAAQPKDENAYDFGPNGFTGRYRVGPETTQVRIVMYGAYTCQFCKQMEAIALDLQSKYPKQVSFSFKHYPMCSDCNPHSEKGKDPEEHRNACWAARCAEACAIYAGANAALAGEDQWTASNDAFWKAHRWLFSIGGNFTDAKLMSGLKEQGFDPDKVTDLMTKPPANNPVVKDLEEGHALGLFQTPMIFLNGIELMGWQQPGALQGAVQALIAANAPYAKATIDHPQLARDQVIAWWRSQPVSTIPPEKSPRAIGPADAPVQVVVFGDFQEENSQKIDKMIRAWVSGPGGLAKAPGEVKPIRYIFKNFPGDKSCNDKLYKTFFEFGCMTAKAAEAAGVVGGEAAYWKMHDWLMNNPNKMGLDAIKKGARAIGLDADAVVTAMGDAAVAAAIQEDVAVGHAIGVGQIPAIYVNGKFLKTWSRDNDNVLERVIEDAAGQPKK